MNTENWQIIKSILDGALAVPQTRRAEFLAHRCGDDAALREEIESLLKFETEEITLFEKSAFDLMMPAAPPPENIFLGRTIGKYKLTKEIGAGGMGLVFLGERADGEFSHHVAVKIIKGINSGETLRRFNLERQILASLEHPYIARLIDGGTTESGLPFLVMEYVEGDSITDYARRHRLDLRARLDLFRQVCAAVAYAHRHLIVHRDLKPSNILITEDGTPKLLDFGIAKIISQKDVKETRTHSMAYTPEYSSPEQLHGGKLTTATDIYSLGVILYELLTGLRPFQSCEESLGKLMAAVTGTEPARPSSAVSDHSPEGTLKSKIHSSRLLKGDLDNVVLKAIKRESDRRYNSVEQFSEDLRRYLAGLPVTARADTLVYRTGKFINRNPLVFLAAMIAIVSLIGGIIAVGYQVRVANAERAKAERRFNDVRQLANSFMFEINEEIDKSPIKARELLVQRALEYLDKLSAEAADDASLQSELATAYEKIGNVQSELFKPSSGKTADALVSHSKSLQIREKLYASNRANAGFGIDVVKSRLSIGDIYSMSGKLAEAKDSYREAVQLGENLSALAPDNVDAKYNLFRAYARLGQAVMRSGSLSQASASYEKASLIIQSLLDGNPTETKFQRGFSIIKNYIGYLKIEKGDPADSVADFRVAMSVMERLAADDPANMKSRSDVAVSHLWLGFALREDNAIAESLHEMRAALEMQKAIFASDVANFGEQNSLGDVYLEYGRTLAKSGQLEAAIGSYENAIENYRTVWRQDNGNISAERQIAVSRRHLADALRQKGDAKAALKLFEQTVEDFSELTADDPSNNEWQYDRAVCYLKIGEILSAGGEKSKAAENFKKAMVILEHLTTRSPETANYQRDFRTVKSHLAGINYGAGA